VISCGKYNYLNSNRKEKRKVKEVGNLFIKQTRKETA